LLAPYAVEETVPPTTVPVIFIFPVELLFAPFETLAEPPEQIPVIFIFPVEALFTPKALAALPPFEFPVIFNVPDDVFATATAEETDPARQFPTIEAVAGEAAVNCRQLREVVVDLWVTFAVSVTPIARVKMPVPSLETSSQVVSTSIVTVCPVLARASSPTPGTTPPVQVAPALKFPVPAEVIRAMA
jgi:hypothetical protein